MESPPRIVDGGCTERKHNGESSEQRLDILELREICKALGIAFVQVTIELDRRLRRA